MTDAGKLNIASSVNQTARLSAALYGKSCWEMQEQLQEVLVSIHQDKYIEPSRITVGQWLYQWLRVYCLSLKKNSACTGYEDEIKLHIVPYLGSIRLQDLKPQQVQLAVNALVQQGKAPATVRKAHAILHAALGRAVIDQMIKHNPASTPSYRKWSAVTSAT